MPSNIKNSHLQKHLSPWHSSAEAMVNKLASISYSPKIISYSSKKSINQSFFRAVEGKRLGVSVQGQN